MKNTNISKNILTEINKEDQNYEEWKQICEIFCKKIGAELLFVNSDSFGYEDKDGRLIHMYADELEQYLKNNKLNEEVDEHLIELLKLKQHLATDDSISDHMAYEMMDNIDNEMVNAYTVEEIEEAEKELGLNESVKDRNGDFILYRRTPSGPLYISGMSTTFDKEKAIKFPTEEEAKEYKHEYIENVVDPEGTEFIVGRLNELNESIKEFGHVNDVWNYLEGSKSEEDLKERISEIDHDKFGSIYYDLHKDGKGATVIMDYQSDNEDYYEKVDVYFDNLNEGVETKAGNDFDEVASYMYNEANGDIDYIPSFEQTDDYIASVTKREYNALYKAVKKAIENVAGHMYNGNIELSNRATINRLTGETLDEVDPDAALQFYQDLCMEGFKGFEDETKVEIWQDGRMGRHIVVADNYENAKDYDMLCNIQEKWEDWVVEEFAKAHSKENIDESVKTINRGPIGNIKYGKYGKYYVALSNNGVSLYKKDPLEFEKNFKGEDFTDAFDAFDKENLVKGYEVDTPEYKKIKDSLKESLKESEDTEEKFQVFMNTWANYNEYGADGVITPTGWMNIDDALEYCDKYGEYEPFINDYENSPIELSEYDNPIEKLNFVKEVLESEDALIIKNALEISDEADYEDVIQKIKDGDYIWFPGCEDDYDLGKDYVDMVGFSGISDIGRYFDEDEFRNSVEYDERDYFASEHGIDTDDEDFPEDEFEEWMDMIVEDEKANFADIAEHDDTYFDYAQLGEDLGWDGYTFTTDGCICLL